MSAVTPRTTDGTLRKVWAAAPDVESGRRDAPMELVGGGVVGWVLVEGGVVGWAAVTLP